MNLNNAYFEAAFGTAAQLPPSDLPEICFAGRSNVGKSSLINKIVNRKALARTSSQPGKTATINFYRLDDLRLVDLPGYGYAKVPFSERDRWSELMEGYFRSGRNVRLVVQLVDMRRPATEDDLAMMKFLRHFRIPFLCVMTKADKLGKAEFARMQETVTAQLAGYTDTVLPFSALSGLGVEEIRALIAEAIA